VNAIMKISASGIRFTIEESQIFQANSFLAKALFHHYSLDYPTDIVLKISFDTLMDVLNMFGNAGSKSTSVRLAFSSTSEDFLLVVLQQGEDVTTTCKLRTMDFEMPMNIQDQMHTKKLNQIILQAAALKDAFSELDWSSDEVELSLSQTDPHFRLRTSGKGGSCEVSYAKDSDSFSNFSVKSDQTARYPLHYLQPAAKGLAEATTASLKTNSDGLLLVQMSIDLSSSRKDGHFAAPTSAALSAFVDFYIMPLADLDAPPDDSEQI